MGIRDGLPDKVALEQRADGMREQSKQRQNKFKGPEEEVNLKSSGKGGEPRRSGAQ